MSYAEFQQQYESAAEEEGARFDAMPVSTLLADIQAGRFGEYHQIWYSLAKRTTVAESAATLLSILESKTDYLHRYHCANALISIAGLAAAGWTPEKLSVEGRFPVRENLNAIRALFGWPPTHETATPHTAAPPALPTAMAAAPQPPPATVVPPRQRRSIAITIAAWITIVISALGLPISFITCLMFIAKSYGTANPDLLGFLTIVGGPPAFLFAGICLLRRHRWARLFIMAALVWLLALNVYGIFRGPTPESSYVDANGVKTTRLASDAQYSPSLMALCAGMLVMLCLPATRAEFSPARTSPE